MSIEHISIHTFKQNNFFLFSNLSFNIFGLKLMWKRRRREKKYIEFND